MLKCGISKINIKLHWGIMCVGQEMTEHKYCLIYGTKQLIFNKQLLQKVLRKIDRKTKKKSKSGRS